MPETSPPQALSQLFIRLFGAAELREFIRFGPDASDIYPRLPESGASRAELALAVVDLLERRGAIDDGLFHRLHRARPGRRAAIDEVAARYLGTRAATTDPRPEVPAQEQPVTMFVPAPSPASPSSGPTLVEASTGTRRIGLRAVVVALALVMLAGGTALLMPSWTEEPPEPTDRLQSSPVVLVPSPRSPEPGPGPATVAPPPVEPAGPSPTVSAVAKPTPPDDTQLPIARPGPRDRKESLRTIQRMAQQELKRCGDSIGAMDAQTVTVTLHVDSKGRVAEATASGTGYGAMFHACVVRAVKLARLPPGPAEAFTYRWKVE